MLFIVDLDMSVADGTARFIAAGLEPHRHDQAAYDTWLGKLQTEEAMLSDRPYTQMRDMLRTLDRSHLIVYLTGRSEMWRNTSVKWLIKNEFPLGVQLYMRGNEDYRSAGEYKAEQVKKILDIYKLPAIAIDDDSAGDTEAEYKKLGVLHLKVMGDRLE